MTQILEHHDGLRFLLFWGTVVALFVGFVWALAGKSAEQRRAAEAVDRELEVLAPGSNDLHQQRALPTYVRDRRSGLCYAYSGREIIALVPCKALEREGQE